MSKNSEWGVLRSHANKKPKKRTEARECCKMCFKVENSPSLIDEVVALFELPLLINDVTEKTLNEFRFYAQVPTSVRNIGGHILSKHDVYEDG
ncbi:hypothetical protein FF1_033071 [Malus domestica]